MNKPTAALIVNALCAGANCGAFAMRVYLGAWDAFNVAVLLLGLGWFAWVLWQQRRGAA